MHSFERLLEINTTSIRGLLFCRLISGFSFLLYFVFLFQVAVYINSGCMGGSREADAGEARQDYSSVRFTQHEQAA